MPMKKFINDPANLVPELLEGYALACGDKIRLAAEKLRAAAELAPQASLRRYLELRAEALAAIASVSRVRMVTRESGEEDGGLIEGRCSMVRQGKSGPKAVTPIPIAKEKR